MPSDSAPQDAATIIADEEEGVAHCGDKCWNHEDVHGDYRLVMIAPKSQRPFGRLWALAVHREKVVVDTSSRV